MCCANKDLVTHGVLHPAADRRLTIDEPQLQTNKLTNPEQHLKKTPLLTHLASHGISVQVYIRFHTHAHVHAQAHVNGNKYSIISLTQWF